MSIQWIDDLDLQDRIEGRNAHAPECDARLEDFEGLYEGGEHHLTCRCEACDPDDARDRKRELAR